MFQINLILCKTMSGSTSASLLSLACNTTNSRSKSESKDLSLGSRCTSMDPLKLVILANLLLYVDAQEKCWL